MSEFKVPYPISKKPRTNERLILGSSKMMEDPIREAYFKNIFTKINPDKEILQITFSRTDKPSYPINQVNRYPVKIEKKQKFISFDYDPEKPGPSKPLYPSVSDLQKQGKNEVIKSKIFDEPTSDDLNHQDKLLINRIRKETKEHILSTYNDNNPTIQIIKNWEKDVLIENANKRIKKLEEQISSRVEKVVIL